MIEKNVLVLQGGGALGAYQAGVYSVLSDEGYCPEWIAGISIGSINAAIIAGNSREDRVAKLKQFWHKVSSKETPYPFYLGDIGRSVFNEFNAANVASFGVDGFFKPRRTMLFKNPFVKTTPDELGIYDTSPLKKTLLDMVEFDRINSNETRLSVGAVEIETGNFTYFDSAKTTIMPEHIMASGALPEGFPPIKVDSQWYWDGGLVSNTPLQYVIDQQLEVNMCIFQIDLFAAQGQIPKTLLEVSQRVKDIRFSSRTRLNTDIFNKTQLVRHALSKVLKHNPDLIVDKDTKKLLEDWSNDVEVTIAHLIYRKKNYETASKDYDFSSLSINEHWQEGEKDALFMLSQNQWKNRKQTKRGVTVFDFNRLQEAK